MLVVGGAVTIPLAHTPDLSTWDQRHDARHYSHRLRTAEETQLCTEWGAGGIPLDAYYQRLFGPSDIDLYLYGLTPEQAKQKVMCPPPRFLHRACEAEFLHACCVSRVACRVGMYVLWGKYR